MRLYGLTITTAEVPSLWGGYADYMYLHANTVLHRVPEGVSADEAAAFVPIANGIRWMSHLGAVGVGDTVVIQGPGQQGLGCVIGAREAGARTVIVTGIAADTDRLEVARDFGADTVIVVDVDETDRSGPGRDSRAPGRRRDRRVGRGDGSGARLARHARRRHRAARRTEEQRADSRLCLRQGRVASVGRARRRRSRRALDSGRPGGDRGAPLSDRTDATHRFRLADAEKAVRSVGREVAGDTPIHATITP